MAGTVGGSAASVGAKNDELRGGVPAAVTFERTSDDEVLSTFRPAVTA